MSDPLTPIARAVWLQALHEERTVVRYGERIPPMRMTTLSRAAKGHFKRESMDLPDSWNLSDAFMEEALAVWRKSVGR